MNIHPMVAEFIPRLLDEFPRREARKPPPPRSPEPHCYPGKRTSVADGSSPNSALYAPEKYPNCQNP